MRKPRDCYQCLNYRLCKLRWDLGKVVRDHLHMLSQLEEHHTFSFGTTVATICNEFKENPEGPI